MAKKGATVELNQIYEPVQKDLLKVEDRLKKESKISNFPQLSDLLEYSLQSSGKRIRPALTLLSGSFYDYNLDLLLPMATAAEIMHTATLVHDDAIDNAATRRNRDTVYKVWGVEKAVLLGDYLFAEAGALTATTNNLRVIKLFAETLKAISTGELNQSFNSFNLNQGNKEYLERVSKKTAALFCMCTESGAVLSNAPEKSIQVLIKYSLNMGIAFQIVDDVLDFVGTEKELGKPIASDLREGTFTLPAMLLLERYPRGNPIKKLFKNKDGNKEDIKKAIEMVQNSTIVQECYQTATEYCEKACRGLKILPSNPSKDSLMALAEFVVSRRK